jgi:hypothetical protein
LNRRIAFWSGLFAIGLSLLALVSCDYSAPDILNNATDGVRTTFPSPSSSPSAPGTPTKSASSPREQEERTAILDSSITLIQRAALQPGGENFKLATQKLNHYFEGTSPSKYLLASAPRQFLSTQLQPGYLKAIENKNWSLRDARHLEDCMMYYGIASRVAGNGENLERVRRVFNWVVTQIQLVPPGALGSARLPQAFARPYDVLYRGMATEAEGYWAERSWLFMVLCRQLGIDIGLITYTKSSTLEPRVPTDGAGSDAEGSLFGPRKRTKVPIVWICAALIDDMAYLFDARVGLEIPGPDGIGVATLDQALGDPAILERMNLPGHSPYGTSRASLLGSPTKLRILIDSSPGYFSPKMGLLERELAGKNRTVLYRDPAEQRDHFVQVVKDHLGVVSLWALPLEVDTRLFTDPQFVQSIQSSLFLFQRDFPLVFARVKQLRGEFSEAIEDYVKFRFAENAPLVNNKKFAIPQDVQDGLDVYATYYLALAHLERNNLDQAELMFKKTLELLPEPGANLPYYNMFRWGANANLGRIYEAKKDHARAIAYDTQNDPTPQYVGNLLRARELVWKNPIAGRSVNLPPAPAAKPSKPGLINRVVSPPVGQPATPAAKPLRSRPAPPPTPAKPSASRTGTNE